MKLSKGTSKRQSDRNCNDIPADHRQKRGANKMSEKLFEGKVAVVTGARTGMGLAAATKFAEQGAAVVLAGRNEPVKEAEELRNRGFKAISVQCDVSRPEDCKKMVDTAIAEFGRLDCAYNNAGIQQEGKFIADMDPAVYKEVMGINCDGVWYCIHYEVQAMLKNGGGTIVNCSSYGGEVGHPGLSAYNASKHALRGITKSVALEYADQNIRVNTICPGTIYTPMVQKMMDEGNWRDEYVTNIPMKRMGTADEMADAVLYLCGPNSSYITGQCILVDGGITCA